MGNGVICAMDVKDMLGLADRGQSLTLCRQLLRGDMTAALETFATMQQGGSDPVQILQDMCDLVHMLTRGQVIANFAAEATLPEYDRQLLTDLSDIKIPALTRAWQILLKGINETQTASHPGQAAEMVLIRMAYAADLPTPADLIKQLRTTNTTVGTTVSAAPPSAPPPAPRAKMMSNGGQVLTPAIADQALPQTDIAVMPAPTNYREVVALFAEKREGALQAHLFSDAHPVRCEPGILEFRLRSQNIPANFVSRLSQCLTQWTGQRWMVSLSDKPGEATLSDIEQAQKKKHHEKVMAHPLMQSVLQAFPGAKVASIKQRAVAPVLTTSDDAVEALDNDITSDLPERED